MNAPHHTARPRVINADHLRMALVARRVRPTTRWAAMSNGADTNYCRRMLPGGGYLVHKPPLLGPMTAGHMRVLLDRCRAQGRAEVLRTWRTSIAVLQAEFSTCVLHTLQATRGAA